MKKIIFTLLFCICIFFSNWAYGLNKDLEKIYSQFLVSLERKYDIQTQEAVLISVRNRVQELLWKNLTERRVELLSDLDILNNEAVFDLTTGNEYLLQNQELREASLKNTQRASQVAYSELAWDFRWVFTPDWRVQKIGQEYFWYNFNTFRYFESAYGVSERDLAGSNISKNENFVYINDTGRVNFISDYAVHPIAQETDVFWLPEKKRFLNELSDDAQFPSSDMSATLQDIRALTQELTAWKSKAESIALIYKWILDNIEYTREIDISNSQIFSGIETFTTGSWVCTGYTKLMLYMLQYAGIRDAEVIRGHVIDAPDFPTIWHAWLRIWDRFYDPTFDDPIWAERTKSVDEYKFYGLPKDIFYANRFDYGSLPESIEQASLDERYTYIFNTLQDLLPKYWNGAKNYLIFKPVLFYQKYRVFPSWQVI